MNLPAEKSENRTHSNVLADGSKGENAAAGPVVLQLVPNLEAGGVERGAVDIARAVVQAGGRALVASAGGRLEPALRRAGGELIRMDIGAKGPLAIRRNGKALAKIVREYGVNVIHARSRAPAWAGWRAAKDTGCAFVTTWHGTYSEGGPFKRKYNSVMGAGRPTIAVSNFIKSHIEARLPEAGPVITIERGIDADLFNDHAVTVTRTAGFIEKWGLLDDPRPVVMLPGRLTRWKGQLDFINAAERLRDIRSDEDFLMFIVGGPLDSKFGRELQEMIHKKHLSSCVRMTGQCDDMPAALKLASLVVSASTEPEAFGRIAAEAQAIGRPVIASGHGGALETVEHEVTGWHYPPGDVQALAQTISNALDLDASQREHMGLAGRARAARHFSLDQMCERTLDVYEEAMRIVASEN